MAIVSGKSNLVSDPSDTDYAPADPQVIRGRPVYATGTVSNLASDNNTSKYKLVEIPSSALLLPDTFFDVENWGFAQVVIGTETDTDALVDVLKSAGAIHVPVAQGDANHGVAFWQILGLAKDPQTKIALWAHAEADATGAGSMPFQIAYLTH
ncbi:hypothetical protein KX928_23335 [Roseobacter sp. YSTF-M11]|uniref:Uncharacterized protein n=1 Tax=Roseobacter insulae TaxID=2859783 RepID=A0A9X1G0L8_9RHOB|nr:hypothetical protein [Roseobacter insulae]MBW4710734.1 hypothetical protein [Roseobacter insulae]